VVSIHFEREFYGAQGDTRGGNERKRRSRLLVRVELLRAEERARRSLSLRGIASCCDGCELPAGDGDDGRAHGLLSTHDDLEGRRGEEGRHQPPLSTQSHHNFLAYSYGHYIRPGQPSLFSHICTHTRSLVPPPSPQISALTGTSVYAWISLAPSLSLPTVTPDLFSVAYNPPPVSSTH
jgi:hypothetical protein